MSRRMRLVVTLACLWVMQISVSHVYTQGRGGGRGQALVLPEGEGKEAVQSQCSKCHSPNLIANSGGYTRQGVTPTDDPRTSPGTLHPLVYVHPETGRRGLYLGRRRNAYIEGFSLDESDALLDEIWASASRDSLTWRHHWRVGDLVLWDNRCTMHRRDAFDAATRRVMHRTQIRSDRQPPNG